MKPLGGRPYRNPSKVDHRLHEGHRKVRNWWEGELGEPNKTAEKREANREIQAELQAAVYRP